MKRIIITVAVFLFSCYLPAHAAEVEGVFIPDSAMVGGQALSLNGTGMRSKFFFDIYIGALYLSHPTHDVKKAMADSGNKRVLMHFLYSQVDVDKLVDGWNTGFKNNQNKAVMKQLQTRLDAFNAMFTDMKKGDELMFDFIDGLTVVVINNQAMGQIAGADFQAALLAVWLGKAPADKSLKDGMLGH